MKMKKSRFGLLALYLLFFLILLFTVWIGIADAAVKMIAVICSVVIVAFGGAFFVMGDNSNKDSTGDDTKENSASQKSKAKEIVDSDGIACSEDVEPEKAGIDNCAKKETYLRFAQEKELTKRETEIGLLVLGDFSNQRISEELFISETTVKKHLTHIYEKCGVACRKEFKQAVIERD